MLSVTLNIVKVNSEFISNKTKVTTVKVVTFCYINSFLDVKVNNYGFKNILQD